MDLIFNPGWAIVGGLVFVGASLIHLARKLESLGSKVVVTSSLIIEPRIVKVDIPVERAPQPPPPRMTEEEKTMMWLRDEISSTEDPPIQLIQMLDKLLFKKEKS